MDGTDDFKTPAIAGERQQEPHIHFKIPMKHLDSTPSSVATDEENNKVDKTKQATKEIHSNVQISSKKEKEAEIVPYKQPVWSGVCSAKTYSLDVLKNGCIVNALNICEKPFYVFGRQLNSDFQLEHPSISRHHAVLQYRAIGDAWELGWYLYDLGSTHGTFVNREKIPPHMHFRLKVGYVLKFGGSSRMYILQGPGEDAEAESTLTVTEIKQRAEKQKIAASLAKIKSSVAKTDDEEDKDKEMMKNENLDVGEKLDEKSEREQAKETGIDWGIKDDVVEEDDDADEDVDEGEKIDFEEIEKREQFYINDPRKALKNFFDREGVELKPEFNEKGSTFNRQWCCRIELPVETNQGRAIFAECTVSGSKKDAFAGCALEACRMLDAYGVLRKSNQESKKRKEKHLEDNDFYDSDEDPFLDRTGELERKREKRMRRSTDEQQVDNYDSLCVKLSAAEEEIKRVERQLGLLHAEIRSKSESNDEVSTTGGVNQERDTLDSYMTEMSRVDENETKVQSSRLRLKLGRLQKEAERLKKLIKIVKPVALPPLEEKSSIQSLSSSSKSGKKLIMTGSIKGHRLRLFVPPPPPAVEQPKQNEQKIETKSEEMIEERNQKEHVDTVNKTEEIICASTSKTDDRIAAEAPVNGGRTESVMEISTECVPSAEEESAPIIKLQKKQNKDAKPKKANKTDVETLGDYDPNDPDYAVWLPPQNQTGDGKTSLNEKLGY